MLNWLYFKMLETKNGGVQYINKDLKYIEKKNKGV